MVGRAKSILSGNTSEYSLGDLGMILRKLFSQRMSIYSICFLNYFGLR